jgi:hypothetical protein
MIHRSFVLALAVVAASRAASAQAAPATVPCREIPCQLVFDWGGGQGASTVPPDRKYGSGDDYEAKFRAAMGLRGYRTKDTPTEGGLVLTVRLSTMKRVMCDQMPGTNPDMSCTAISATNLTFASTDPKVKAPGSVRINNRCASNGIYMLNRDFAQYSVDMLWYNLEGEAAKGERPVSKC